MKTLPTRAPAADAVVRVEAEGDSTRHRVAQSILEHGPSTASELAERLSLTAAAVRRHLGSLTESGEIDSREQRVYGQRGRGRPSRVFFLTDTGRTAFHQAYDDLAIQALRSIEKVGGVPAVAAVADLHLAEVETEFHRVLEANPELEKIEALAIALTADGYVASIKPARAGEQLCQHHCPVAHVAEQFPEICEAETRMFSRLLDSHVQRLATIAHGDGICTTHVPSQLARRDGAPPLKARMTKRASRNTSKATQEQYTPKGSI